MSAESPPVSGGLVASEVDLFLVFMSKNTSDRSHEQQMKASFAETRFNHCGAFYQGKETAAHITLSLSLSLAFYK